MARLRAAGRMTSIGSSEAEKKNEDKQSKRRKMNTSERQNRQRRGIGEWEAKDMLIHPVAVVDLHHSKLIDMRCIADCDIYSTASSIDRHRYRHRYNRDRDKMDISMHKYGSMVPSNFPWFSVANTQQSQQESIRHQHGNHK